MGAGRRERGPRGAGSLLELRGSVADSRACLECRPSQEHNSTQRVSGTAMADLRTLSIVPQAAARLPTCAQLRMPASPLSPTTSGSSPAHLRPPSQLPYPHTNLLALPLSCPPPTTPRWSPTPTSKLLPLNTPHTHPTPPGCDPAHRGRPHAAGHRHQRGHAQAQAGVHRGGV